MCIMHRFTKFRLNRILPAESWSIDFSPPNEVFGGLRFYCNSYYIFSFRWLPSALTERKWTKTSYMFENRPKCDFKMHVQNLVKIGSPQTTNFRRLRNLTATVTAYIFAMNIYVFGQVRWKIQGVSYITSFQNVMNLGPRTA